MRASTKMTDRKAWKEQKKGENERKTKCPQLDSEDADIDPGKESPDSENSNNTNEVKLESSACVIRSKTEAIATEQLKDKTNKTTKKQTPKAKKATSSTSNDNASSPILKILSYVVCLIAIVAAIILIPGYFPNESNEQYGIEAEEPFDYTKIFQDRLKIVQQNFSGQSERFWRILRSRGLSHLRNKNPRQPLVFLLGAPPSSHAVIDCLAKKLAWSLDPMYSIENIIDGSKFSESEGHRTKEVLDNSLKGIFQRGVRSALVLHLEKLPPPSPLLFYSYCDNDVAPYKHAGIIFTVYLPWKPKEGLSAVEAEGSIENFLLREIWSGSGYDSDAISALLSRIADTVALVSPESDGVIHSSC